jgi:DNA-binding MarR family transcriptional regulator
MFGTQSSPFTQAEARGLRPTAITALTAKVAGSRRVTLPSSRRSFRIRLTAAGHRVVRNARPRFRAYVEAVEARLGKRGVAEVRDELAGLREAIDAEVAARAK